MGFGRVLAAPLVLGVCVCGWSPLVGFGLRGSPRQIGRAGLAFLLHQTPRTSAGSPVCTMSSGFLPRFSLALSFVSHYRFSLWFALTTMLLLVLCV